MAKKTYDIPGVAVTIKDYQIKPEPITTPGDIVVYLADMPDTIETPNPDGTDSMITVPYTANIPIIITDAADLTTLLSGTSGDDNRDLDILNVLSIIGTANTGNKPTAICKIVKRDGTRPDMLNAFEVYEALEFAYESLENYPAGMIVPVGVAFEDTFVVAGDYTDYYKVTKVTDTVSGNAAKISFASEDDFAPTVAETFTVDFLASTDKLTVEVNGESVTVTGGAATLGVTSASATFTLTDGVILTVATGFNAAADSSYKVNIIPVGADIVNKSLTFCHELTTNLNECRVFFGTRPPKNTSSVEVKKQVDALVACSKTAGFVSGTTAAFKVDLGMYLVTVVGVQSNNGVGGLSHDVAKAVTVTDSTHLVITGLAVTEFKDGDYVEISTTNLRTPVNAFAQIDTSTASGGNTNLVLKVALGTDEVTAFQDAANDVFIYNINKRDTEGSYVAALYATTANNYGLDKAPMNVVLDGVCEVIYSRKQLIALNNKNYTVINRAATSTNGYVVDTPTMALDASDFTEQSTVGLLFYFINRLRSIANSKKGQRFGDATKQVLFKTELEAPLLAEKGNTIIDYQLNVDFSLLNRQGICLVDFGIYEAKTLKFVKITARLY